MRDDRRQEIEEDNQNKKESHFGPIRDSSVREAVAESLLELSTYTPAPSQRADRRKADAASTYAIAVDS